MSRARIEDARRYQRSYYRKNRDARSAERRARYAEDPEARARAQARSRANKEANPQQLSERVYYRDVMANGLMVSIPVYPTGHVAKIIGKTPQAIRVWESKGWIPEPIFTDKTVCTPSIKWP